MLTIYTSTSVAEATGYYIDAKTQEAYYSEGQEFTGFWVGQAAARLGLSGRVDKESFVRLCENRHPATGEPLTARTRKKRRIGTDFTVGVPKSVSLGYAYTGDERIILATRQAGADMIADIEQAVGARIRKNGEQYKTRLTKNWAGGEFVHLTARPEGGIPDPHLHIHYFMFNATHDGEEDVWKAAELREIMDHADDYGKMFLARLAENLKKLGLEITPTEKSFELAGFPRELIERYSRRTKKIEDTALRLGITDPAQKAKLAAMTRENKSKTLLMPELRELWWVGLSEEDKKPFKRVEMLLQRSRTTELSREITLTPETKVERTADLLGQQRQVAGDGKRERKSLNRQTKPGPAAVEVVQPTEHDRRAVAFAMEHLYERQSMVTERQLIGEAFRGWSLGRATLAGVRQVIAETPLLRADRNGREYVTTAEVMAEEQRLVNQCQAGKGRLEEINPYWRIEDTALNAKQQAAVKHILTSKDWVVGISGKAGTGETTLLHEVRRGVEAGCYKLIPLAPSAEAARDTLRKEGFQNAETVAKLLTSERFQKEARGAVWLVDEAGLLSTRQTDKLFALAKELDARLVLVGDVGQHHAVERGQAFDLLERFGGMATATVNEVVRQRGTYKQFVEYVSEGKLAEAFEVRGIKSHIKEMNLEERKVALAEKYVTAIEKGKTALVVAPTHAECDEVTAGIRDVLKQKEHLGESTTWDTLRNLSWTKAAKMDAEHYERGLVVQFNGHVKGFALGEQVEVIDVRDGMVRVRSHSLCHDAIKSLPLDKAEKFNVYEREQQEICAGELIRITANSRTEDDHRLYNGNLYTVDYIDHAGRLVLDNGWILDKDFAHLQYGYTLTSHAAQGKTVDCVYISQTAKHSSLASDLKQFYVSVSRGREDFEIYTDDIELLIENVSQVRERPMAMEMLAEHREDQRLEPERGKLAEKLGKSDDEDMEAELEEALQNEIELHEDHELAGIEELAEQPCEPTIESVPQHQPAAEPEQTITMSMSM